MEIRFYNDDNFDVDSKPVSIWWRGEEKGVPLAGDIVLLQDTHESEQITSSWVVSHRSWVWNEPETVRVWVKPIAHHRPLKPLSR